MQIFSTQSSTLDRFLGWWYALSTPSGVTDFAPLEARASLRRARFTSIILLIEIVYHLVNFAVSRDFSLPTESIFAVTIIAFVVAIILNRAGKTAASGILGFLVIQASVCFTLISTGIAPGGMAVKDLPLIPLQLLPEIIAISLFPSVVACLLCVFNGAMSVSALLFFPKTPELAQLLATNELPLYFQLLGIQCVGIALSFFWVSNTRKEMQRADRAEEVGKLTQTLAMQQNTTLVDKQQIEENMQQIIAVHMKVANGDFEARVPLEPQSALWSVGISLNNLLARLQVWRREEQKRQQRTEQAIQGLVYEIKRAKFQGRPLHIQKTGTPLDLILDELSHNKTSSQPITPQAPIRLSAPPEAKG